VEALRKKVRRGDETQFIIILGGKTILGSSYLGDETQFIIILGGKTSLGSSY
jgi:hypothetical protein